MTVDLLPPGSPAWDEVLRRTEHDFYHLPEYLAFAARMDGGEPRAVHVREGDRELLLPVLVRDVGGGLRDAGSPYGYPGPLVAGGDVAFATAALLAARERLAREGIVTLFVRGHPVLGPPLPDEIGTVVDHGPTVSIDLELPPQELWRQTRPSYRQQISRALREGHRVFLDERFERMAAFVEIYRATMERVAAPSYYMFPDSYFAELR